MATIEVEVYSIQYKVHQAVTAVDKAYKEAQDRARTELDKSIPTEKWSWRQFKFIPLTEAQRDEEYRRMIYNSGFYPGSEYWSDMKILHGIQRLIEFKPDVSTLTSVPRTITLEPKELELLNYWSKK